MCPLPPESPSHLPPHPTSLGCHKTLNLCSLCHTANSHWLSILHMVIYIFNCCSLNSSHHLLSLLCPQVCSFCLCFLCCAIMIKLLFHSPKLNSNYPHCSSHSWYEWWWPCTKQVLCAWLWAKHSLITFIFKLSTTRTGEETQRNWVTCSGLHRLES